MPTISTTTCRSERLPILMNGWQIDDAARTAAIVAHDVESIRDSAGLKRITDFAAALCDAPVSLVSLIEKNRQSFLARTGLDTRETPRETSFCVHAMLEDDVMVVPDTAEDPRFIGNPHVIGEPFVRFYAGAPLVTDDGVPLGALCVLDTVPRQGLTPLQRHGLATLAESVMVQLRDSRDAAAWRTAENDARRALSDSEGKFHTLADTMPQMVWSTLPNGFHDYYNARWYEFTGVPEGSTDGERWNGVFHPDDRERARDVWRHSLATGDPYGIEYRLRHRDGTYRWVLGRALPMHGENGAITRWFGTCTDIHEQKLASEEREMISQELSHRIKNIFAVIAGLIGLASRNRPEFAAISTDLRQRITALGRAHDFVRPHSARSERAIGQNSLHGLLIDLFDPYQRIEGDRIAITGDHVAIDDRSATPLALVFHELATNATKYGALSTDDGMVEVSIARLGDTVKLSWSEKGGPPTIKPAGLSGFGSQLIELSAVRQLGGTVTRDWRPEGLILTIDVPAAALSRG